MLRRCACFGTQWRNISGPYSGQVPLSTQLVLYNSRRLHESRYCTQNEVVPLRKQLKDARRFKRGDKDLRQGKRSAEIVDSKWELTVGIEIHAQLNTASKLFSPAQASVNAPPNTDAAIFDLAVPGSQPVLQKPVILPALRAAIALQCQIQNVSYFDRKHYFYHDQPAGYQITQFYRPLARDGRVKVDENDGIDPNGPDSVDIGIKQIQLEQDTAKTLEHQQGTVLLDFNRVGQPLVEIISLPEIHSPITAAAFVRKVQALLLSVDAVVTGMEDGGLRADVNVSIRRRDSIGIHGYSGITGLGKRTEIKNLGTIKSVELAVRAEQNRQINILESGGVVRGETRGWSLTAPHETRRLRSKEGEVDYRYMPDPDIPPLTVDEKLIQYLSSDLPPLPDKLSRMLIEDSQYSLTAADARILPDLDDGERLDFYQEVVEKLHSSQGTNTEIYYKIGRLAGNWVIQELGSLMSKNSVPWADQPITTDTLANILDYLLRRKITGKTAKQLLGMMFQGDTRSVKQIIEDDHLEFKPMSPEEYKALAHQVIQQNESSVNQIRQKGQIGKIKFLLGQMIRLGEDGRVEAQDAEKALQNVLFSENKRFFIDPYTKYSYFNYRSSDDPFTACSPCRSDMTSPSTIKQKFLSKPSELGVVAVGFSGGQCKPGVDAAPTALIASGLLDQLRDDLGYALFGDKDVNFYSSVLPQDDPAFRQMKNPLAVSTVTQSLSRQIYDHARKGRFVLTLGGDHSIAIGTISGTAKATRELQNKEVAVIWVDAHADINTPETSDSGNVHGMPAAFLTGLATSDRKDIFGWLEKDQLISVKKLVYIGLRDVDRAEKIILRENNIRAFSMHDIDKHGIGRVVEMALAHIGSDTPIHLTFDVDALDPQWAPSTGTPVRGGLTLREGDYIAEAVHGTGQLVAMDLVEVNPSLEAKGASETIRAGCSLVRCALGDTLL
ncbi:MAG: hypothetical protein Q9160_001169 [Pyrenula sp. 1 TL-2023]